MTDPLHVLSVIPGQPDDTVSMVFCRRQIDRLEEFGVKVTRFYLTSRTNPFELITVLVRLRRTIREVRPDVVHAQFGTVTGWITTRASSVPVVVSFRGNDLNPDPSANSLRQWISHRLSHLAAHKATRIICVSQELRNHLRRSDQAKADVIPMGVNTRVFHPMPSPEARQALGWDHQDPVLLFNASRDPGIKRLDLAEAAFRNASKAMPSLRFEVMRGEVKPEKVPLLMNAANALLLTSDSEGSPNVVKEAMACGLPVISVDVGDVALRLAEVSPSRISSRDPATLAKCIVDVIAINQRSNGPSVVARDLCDITIAQRVQDVLHKASSLASDHSP